MPKHTTSAQEQSGADVLRHHTETRSWDGGWKLEMSRPTESPFTYWAVYDPSSYPVVSGEAPTIEQAREDGQSAVARLMSARREW